MPDDKTYQESIKWKFGELKEAPAGPKKKKTRPEMIKRLFVGFFVMAIYINSYLVSTLTMALMPYFLMLNV